MSGKGKSSAQSGTKNTDSNPGTQNDAKSQEKGQERQKHIFQPYIHPSHKNGRSGKPIF